jgi:hypothetical protein
VHASPATAGGVSEKTTPLLLAPPSSVVPYRIGSPLTCRPTGDPGVGQASVSIVEGEYLRELPTSIWRLAKRQWTWPSQYQHHCKDQRLNKAHVVLDIFFLANNQANQ